MTYAPPPTPQDQPNPNQVPNPGFSRVPPSKALPGWDPSDSPLVQGGRAGTDAPNPADTSLQGLLATPEQAGRPRVMFRVRREGWVARRSAARSRFGQIHKQRGSSTPRILSGLKGRGGLLGRSRSRAVRPRFNLRGHL